MRVIQIMKLYFYFIPSEVDTPKRSNEIKPARQDRVSKQKNIELSLQPYTPRITCI
jgi:hypothetical protein